jgi:hypothetical protein
MNANRYIYYLLQTPLGTLSVDDETYLRYILQGYTSAYAIQQKMLGKTKRNDKTKKEFYYDYYYDDDDSSSPYGSFLKPPAYININKRVRKLYKLGFLEELKVPGGFLHGARKYKISEKGFVYLFARNAGLNFYKYFGELVKTDLFQIFIAPYFDNKTLQDCTKTLSWFIVFYLQDICTKISNSLNPEILERYNFDRTIPLTEQYGKINNQEDNLVYLNPHLYNLFIRLINSYKSLILDLISLDQRMLYTRYLDDEEDKRKTLTLLSKDKKFMTTLKKVKKEIDNQIDQLL